jgi:hypothetical protein
VKGDALHLGEEARAIAGGLPAEEAGLRECPVGDTVSGFRNGGEGRARFAAREDGPAGGGEDEHLAGSGIPPEVESLVEECRGPRRHYGPALPSPGRAREKCVRREESAPRIVARRESRRTGFLDGSGNLQMRVDFELSSRHRFLVLYDPAALPPDLPLDPDLSSQEPDPPPDDAVRRLGEDGRALVVEFPADWESVATLRLFVEEQPPPALTAKSTPIVVDALLRIPGGTIRAAGSEFMCRSGEVRQEADAGSPAQVPPGDYLLTVREFVRWKRSHLGAEIRARTTGFARLYDALGQRIGCFVIFVLVASFLVLPGAVVVAWSEWGWPTAWRTGGVILALDVVAIAWVLLSDALRKLFPTLNVSEVREQLEAEHPDFVVTLRGAKGTGGSGQAARVEWPAT